MSLRETINEGVEQIPWWIKVLLGITGLFVSWKVFPVVELLNLFFLIVVVPFCIIGSGWLVASGTAEAVQKNLGEIIDGTMENLEAAAASAANKVANKEAN